MHEFGGQPVEQFRVRRRGSLRAEVLAGFDNSAPEELFPGPVPRDAWGQRVLFTHQPSREAETIRHLIVTEWMQRRRNACVHLLALVHEAAAPTDERGRAFLSRAPAPHEH